MKYISVIEDKVYLLWQQEVQIKNLEELGELDKLTVVILYQGDSPSVYARTLAQQCDVKYYPVPDYQGYSPMNKPYGMMKYLEEVGRQENVMLIDSDVIFKLPQNTENFTDPDTWYMSNCDGYLGIDYLLKHLSEKQLREVFALANLEEDNVLSRYVGGGAQYFFKHISAEDCKEVANLCIPLYTLLKSFETKVQVWTAEMWAWLFVGIRQGYTLEISHDLDFCWATDPATMWNHKNILHLAGVVSKETGHFYKGFYTRQPPWVKLDFSYVTNKHSCSWLYFSKMKDYFNIQE